MVDNTHSSGGQDGLEHIKQLVAEELRSTQTAINETTMSLEKIRQEVNKLTQRNTDISSVLQRTVTNLESVQRSDIRTAYENALDAQKRYLLIHGQMEKLQADQQAWQHYGDVLKAVENYLHTITDTSTTIAGDTGLSEVNETIRIEEAERTRLSKLMHDGPAQVLTNFILQTEIALRAYDVDATQAKEELSNLKTSAMKVFQRIRNFIFELKPFTIEDQGLVQTLKKYFDAYKEQTGIDVAFKQSGSERDLGPTMTMLVFRAIQELLYNILNYSQASLASIQLEYNDRSIEIQVEDNGKGFDTGKLSNGRQSGLMVMKERIEGLGGNLHVESNIDVGTRVKFDLPAQKEYSA